MVENGDESLWSNSWPDGESYDQQSEAEGADNDGQEVKHDGEVTIFEDESEGQAQEVSSIDDQAPAAGDDGQGIRTGGEVAEFQQKSEPDTLEVSGLEDQVTTTEDEDREDMHDDDGDVEEPQRSPNENSDSSNQSLPAVDQALIYAFTAKVRQLTINLICFGFEHRCAQEALKHAWNLSRRNEGWKEDLQVKAGEFGFYLREMEDGGFETVKLDGLGDLMDNLRQQCWGMRWKELVEFGVG